SAGSPRPVNAPSTASTATWAARAPSEWPPMPSATTSKVAPFLWATAARSWLLSRLPMRETMLVSVSMSADLNLPVMTLSMTGFARAEADTEFGTLSWEARTVNHRHLDLSLRLPEECRALEPEVRERVGSRV